MVTFVGDPPSDSRTDRDRASPAKALGLLVGLWFGVVLVPQNPQALAADSVR